MINRRVHKKGAAGADRSLIGVAVRPTLSYISPRGHQGYARINFGQAFPARGLTSIPAQRNERHTIAEKQPKLAVR
jgi:hypothetical protein